jgi:ribonuclease Z
MVHETTLEQAMAEKANSRGHSSSQQTAALAKEAGSARLSPPTLARATMPKAVCDAGGMPGDFPNTLLAEDFMVYKMA